MKHIPKHMKKILWEYDTDTLIIESTTVLDRVLSCGDTEDIQYIGLPKLKNYFRDTKPLLDEKSHNFWCVICDISDSSPSYSLYDQINHPKPLRRIG